MSRLLETRLPFSQGDSVSSETFNRLIRILEINLSAVDFTISPHYNSGQISELQFATGSIIFNTTNQIHQAFDGNILETFITIKHTHQASRLRLQLGM
jgi:hypothetical protein